jgi:Zn-dependent peptidase ImmA (M78 family)
MSSDEVTREVKRLLNSYSILKPPVPVDKIAERLGLELMLMELDADMSGALIRSDDGETVMIAVNETHSRVRRRFTVAHEIAHYVLGHLTDEPHIDREFTAIHRNEVSSQATDPREIKANTFAASLLMPEDFLLKDFVKSGGFDGLALSQMALRYQVSEQALKYRLANLGLLPPF